MKNCTLISSAWKQRIAPVLTLEEKALRIAPVTDENRDAKTTLNESILDRSFADLSTEEATQCAVIYNANKIEGATLIAADITLPDGHGIINCRVNGEHKQIRF